MYLEAFFEDGVDHEALVHALGVVARARGGMSKLAKETGISRRGLLDSWSSLNQPPTRGGRSGFEEADLLANAQ
jgi:probable addiction module antidote protein